MFIRFKNFNTHNFLSQHSRTSLSVELLSSSDWSLLLDRVRFDLMCYVLLCLKLKFYEVCMDVLVLLLSIFFRLEIC